MDFGHLPKHLSLINAWAFYITVAVGTYSVEDPDLAITGGLGHAVSVVVEQYALVLGVAAQRRAQLLHLFHGRVERLLVPSLGLPSLVLLL